MFMDFFYEDGMDDKIMLQRCVRIYRDNIFII